MLPQLTQNMYLFRNVFVARLRRANMLHMLIEYSKINKFELNSLFTNFLGRKGSHWGQNTYINMT